MKERLNLTPASAVQGGFHLSALQERYATAVIRVAEVPVGSAGVDEEARLPRGRRAFLLRVRGCNGTVRSVCRVPTPVCPLTPAPECDPADCGVTPKLAVTGIRLVVPAGNCGLPRVQ